MKQTTADSVTASITDRRGKGPSSGIDAWPAITASSCSRPASFSRCSSFRPCLVPARTDPRREPGASSTFPVTIRIDASKTHGEMRPVWRFFGYDEPNYTYMKDGKKLLGQLAALSPQPVYIRTHNLLTSGDGTPALKWGSTGVYSEDDRGQAPLRLDDHRPDLRHLSGARRPALRPDRLHARGALDTAATPISTTGRRAGKEVDLDRLGLSAQGLREVGRAGLPVGAAQRRAVRRAEVETLVLGGLERAEHHVLAGHARGVPQALRLCRRRREAGLANGPGRRPARRRDEVAGGDEVLRDFLEHCLRGDEPRHREEGSPLDFMAFHAKGQPRFVDGHVRTGIAAQLQDIDRGFEIVASFPS